MDGRSAPTRVSSWDPHPLQTLSQPQRRTASSQPPRLSTMKTKFRRQKTSDNELSSLNAAISALDLARDTTSLKQSREAFRSASALLATTRVSLLLVLVGRLLSDVRRTWSSTKRILWNWGYPVPISANPLTRESMADGHPSLVHRSLRRLKN